MSNQKSIEIEARKRKVFALSLFFSRNTFCKNNEAANSVGVCLTTTTSDGTSLNFSYLYQNLSADTSTNL